jgi:serine/threonine protein kinase
VAGDPSDKRTQIGTAPPATVRQTGASPVARAATPVSTPVPAAGTTPPSAPIEMPAPAPGTGPVYIPPVDPLLGQTLAGRYMIHKKLGEGGMGAVYLAVHTLLEKQVALKVLHGEFARKPDLVERFMQEAKSASRIRHENVIDISDFGVTPDGFVFFAMELLQGHDLHEEISRARLANMPLPWERSRKIFLQICSALAAAHSHGIVHRDLKPENIYLIEFLGHRDFVKLLDFGIAKLTEVSEGDRKLTKTGMLFGTPEYMSPEQARGDTVDHRVDIYAMGCILYQLVVGRVPFEAENFMGILSQHLTEAPVPIDPAALAAIGAPPGVAGIVMRALAKHRDERWATIDDMANAIRALHGEAQQPVHEVNVPRATSASSPNSAAPGSRVRTKWTGNLHVPMEDVAPAKPQRSLAPWIAAGVILVAGAIVVAYVLTRPAKTVAVTPTPPPPIAGSGATPGSATIPTTPPDLPPTPPLAPVPAEVSLRLVTKPAKATVFEVSEKGEVRLGVTPLTVGPIKGSHDARRYAIRLKNYQDKLIEITPDTTPIEWSAALERGSSSKPAVVEVVVGGGPGLKPVKNPKDAKDPKDGKPPGTDPGPVTSPVTDPDPPVIKPPDPVPPDKDPDLIDLKPPERKGSGSPASGS